MFRTKRQHAQLRPISSCFGYLPAKNMRGKMIFTFSIRAFNLIVCGRGGGPPAQQRNTQDLVVCNGNKRHALGSLCYRKPEKVSRYHCNTCDEILDGPLVYSALLGEDNADSYQITRRQLANACLTRNAVCPINLTSSCTGNEEWSCNCSPTCEVKAGLFWK